MVFVGYQSSKIEVLFLSVNMNDIVTPTIRKISTHCKRVISGARAVTNPASLFYFIFSMDSKKRENKEEISNLN